ncbi:MAG: PilN domain-containing protein [Syntrophomonas sp.]|uniref:PilN domain-containing protein n=1 Tax=Syntrophomonas sp. TaxID=2053627 RepID=UPI0026110EEB|nr:PilN domain-containing protein [Syntrophomonas sp.]MDD2510230.1 PilN domain-containing protein [Syntrophomonas sp.]MDD3880568.1 PilN domain-containing protein [Syntrophomonas sp.]MDD4627169.1 PilN domain-containing protein [Syntrophomonas sp.]
MRRHSRISINLLNKAEVNKQKVAFISGIIVLLLLSGGMYCFYHSAHQEMLLQEKHNKNLQARAQELLPLAFAGRIQEEQEENAWQRRKILDETRLQQISYVEIFKEIERSIPPGVVILGIEIEKGRIAIQGLAADHQELSFLMAGMRGKSSFGYPKLLSSNINEDGQELEFRVEVNWGGEAD